MTPEERARQTIDQLLTAAGWAVQDVKRADLHAARGGRQSASSCSLQPPRFSLLDSQLYHHR
jgi:type I site-specific restriction endonuclease